VSRQTERKYAMRIRRSLHVLVPLVFVGFVGACTNIPRADLKSYRESFGVTRAASEDILDDHARTVEANAAIEATVAAKTQGQNAQPFRFDPKFNPNAVGAVNGQNQDVLARRLALAAMARYNDILATLAEGKSVEEVQASFDSFKGSMTVFLDTLGASHPYAAAGASLLKTLVAVAEKSRTREEFRQALEQGEPIIVKMIDEVFIPDTADFYEMRSNVANYNWRIVRRKGLDQAKMVTLISAEHREPTTESLKASKAQVQSRLATALRLLDHAKTTIKIRGEDRQLSDISGRTGAGPPYTELVEVRLTTLVDSTEATASEYRQIIEDMIKYKEVLNEYVALLNQTRTTLQRVRERLDAPPDIEAMARQLSLTAFQVKADIDQLRAAVKTNRNQ
jgi:hypothetical protein